MMASETAHRPDPLCAAAAGASAWPPMDGMTPSRDVVAQAPAEVDPAGADPGSRITVTWRRKPAFIDRRPPARIAQSRAGDRADMPDPEAHEARGRRDG